MCQVLGMLRDRDRAREVTSRDRTFATLRGGVPDRIPIALGFRPAPLENYAPRGYSGIGPDVVAVSFKPSDVETKFSEQVARRPYDTRLGTPQLLASYKSWRYWHPDGSRNPLARAGTVKEILDFRFPNQSHSVRHAHLPGEVDRLKKAGFAVAGGLPHLGGEMFETGWRLRGLERWLLDLIERPDLAAALLDKLRDICIANSRILATAGVDILVLDDDVGMPTTMIISPDIWAEFLRPRLAQIIAAAREVNPAMFVLYHSDGWIEPIIEGLIEIGVDALNPVQPNAMQPERIKRLYGDKITIWGSVGTQGTFSDGMPADIEAETRRRIASLGPKRLILGPAYDLMNSSRLWPNLEAFLRTVEAYG